MPDDVDPDEVGPPRPPEDPVDPGPGVAASHGAVRSAVRARTSAYGGALAASVAALVVFVILATTSSTSGERLRNDGTTVPGTILAEDGGSSVDVGYHVAQEDFTATVILDDVARSYAVGDVVDVHADASDPQVMTIDDQDNQGVWSVRVTIVALLVGLVGVPVSAFAAVRWARAAWMLRRFPFEQATLVRTSLGAPLGHRKEVSLHVGVAGDAVHLHRSVVMPPSTWREVSHLVDFPPGPVWVARRGRRWVLARQGGASPWVLRTPRSEAQARAWAARDTAPDSTT